MQSINEDQFISIEETLEGLAVQAKDNKANVAGMLLKQGVAARLEYDDDGKPEKENANRRLVPYFRSPDDGMIYPADRYLKNCSVMQDALESWKNLNSIPANRMAAYGKYGWLRADLYKFLNSKGVVAKWLMPTNASAAKLKDASDTSPSGDDWTKQARAIADECFDHDTKAGVRDSLATKNSVGHITGGYCFRVMGLMQERGIKGARGIITNPATIMREALQGKKWWANKQK